VKLRCVQKFFGSFFQKRTERKNFFFEKKKQKTFFNLALVYGLIDLLVLGVALDGFDLRVPWCSSRLRG